MRNKTIFYILLLTLIVFVAAFVIIMVAFLVQNKKDNDKKSGDNKRKSTISFKNLPVIKQLNREFEILTTSGKREHDVCVENINVKCFSNRELYVSWLSKKCHDDGSVIIKYVDSSTSVHKTHGPFKISANRAIITGLNSDSMYKVSLYFPGNEVEIPFKHSVQPTKEVPDKFRMYHESRKIYVSDSIKNGKNELKHDTKSNNYSLFHKDQEGYICSVNETDMFLTSTKCSDDSNVIYSDNGEVFIDKLTNIKTRGIEKFAKWKYNRIGDNTFINENNEFLYLHENDKVYSRTTGTRLFCEKF